MTQNAPEKSPLVPGIGFDKAVVVPTIADLNTLYPPGVRYRSYLGFVKSPAGVQDAVYACKKDSANVYHWEAVSGVELSWEYDGLDGTLRTILPAGSIVDGVMFDGIMVSSTAVKRYPDGNVEPGSSQVIDFGGGNQVTIASAAGGDFTIQRTAGALTYHVKLKFMPL